MVAPCGRRLRSMSDVRKYLQIVDSRLEIDHFNFDWFLHIRQEFEPERKNVLLEDISYGKENVPFPAVNSVDQSIPDSLDYCTVRLPQTDVNINLDNDFLVCCDCDNDCMDKDKCACQQMTVAATAAMPDNVVVPSAGYVDRRLYRKVLTGIFECNDRCKCKYVSFFVSRLAFSL